MKTRTIVLAGILLICGLVYASNAQAQCAMCTLNAENSVKDGNTQGNSLNTGIFYLLAAPYLAIMGIGFIWYKRYRRSQQKIA